MDVALKIINKIHDHNNSFIKFQFRVIRRGVCFKRLKIIKTRELNHKWIIVLALSAKVKRVFEVFC